MTLELLPHIHQIKVPLRGNPLGFVNSYLLQTGAGLILVDCGWNTPDAFAALQAGFDEAGSTLADLRYVVVTHIHPDHYGLAGRILEHTDAELVVHERERRLTDSRYVNYSELLDATEDWLRVNGVDTDSRPVLQKASLSMLDLVAPAKVGRCVLGGERLELGGRTLELLWTPGHSPGHLCLYEPASKLLFAGDHVLERITPNVGMTTQTQSNPLADYQNALRQIRDLDVALVAPGHGDAFTDLPGRVDALLAHHESRLSEIAAAVRSAGSATAYDVARSIRWFKPWDALAPFSQRSAVFETLSHLEMLLSRGSMHKQTVGGVWRYRCSSQ
ncbi:MAG: MBL fold metallo-hydrolase [Coriobacteriaceae bacterium]|jgi:glyoxylase-like metal-dependent hydrolase (beta-lactamase superfamily II)|nr:MBL fold metallo-hydrolase [Coriobacteriaceae bacterium]